VFLSSGRPGGIGNGDLWTSTRATARDAWSTPVNLGPRINTASNEIGPARSLDGTALYFQSDRPGGHGGNDLYVITRTRITE